MSDGMICSMCGQRFDPADQATCQGCPLHNGCQLVRCPHCGFETVNPQNSKLARWAKRWFGLKQSTPAVSAAQPTLAEIAPGREARITGFLPGMAPERRNHLQAYGLTPGCQVRVVQHSPVTIIQLEQLELALEQGLASQVQVGN